MLTLETIHDLKDHVGKKVGSSDWIEITQKMIDQFADATGDHQWIHVDVERAKREGPGGKTIAHGFLTLSLVAGLSGSIMQIKKRSRGINYGVNKVRFINMVPVGSRVRLHQSIVALEPVQGGVRIINGWEMEIENASRPAMVAETITIVYE